MIQSLRPPPLAPDPGRLDRLREELARRGLDGFVIPRADEYQGEYVPAQAERLAWLTGFTGSAGYAVVTQRHAVLFVDGRYTLQADAQAKPLGFEVCHQATCPFDQWLADVLEPRQRLGFDPWLHTVGWLEKTRKTCEDLGAELVGVTDNPIDALWTGRPLAPLGAVLPHPVDYAGEPSSAKRARIADLLAKEGDGAAVITAPDAIAWLLNLRGGDVPHTPLPLGFAVIEATGRVDLFMDGRKLTPAAWAHLDNAVTLNPPEELGARLDALGEQGLRVRLDAGVANAWVLERLHRAGVAIRRDSDVCALPKACKNATELEGTRACHRRDALAMCRFLHWVAVEAPRGRLTELDVIAEIERQRSRCPLSRGVSFDTIAGFGPNGAVVHYRASPATNRVVAPDGLLLVDSGGQYLDGTTDITRTVAVGRPSDAMRRHFTLVLKGHIAVATARFPEGTTGSQLDPLARQFLWRQGLDFDHGTGHGVGSYLSVHEGPQRVSKAPNTVALRPGMILSNEPGYYADGAYGIRIENLIVVRPSCHLP
ncbi:MAG: aminopeptidase P family protein, partial [Rhodospirillaceae bacterium]|nr:aminopeptidase P family protein [Rhodospirillaceae bacterium]